MKVQGMDAPHEYRRQWAIGDIHGAHRRLLELLGGAGIVDDQATGLPAPSQVSVSVTILIEAKTVLEW